MAAPGHSHQTFAMPSRSDRAMQWNSALLPFLGKVDLDVPLWCCCRAEMGIDCPSFYPPPRSRSWLAWLLLVGSDSQAVSRSPTKSSILLPITLMAAHRSMNLESLQIPRQSPFNTPQRIP